MDNGVYEILPQPLRLPMPSPPTKKPTPPAPTKRPMSLVFHGISGSGKSSLAAQFPKPGFICDSQERGICYLADLGIVPPPVFIDINNDVDSWRTWDSLLQKIYDAAINTKIETLVIEAMTGIEVICFLHHAKQKFATSAHPDGDLTSEGFYSFYKGPKNAGHFDFPHFITALNAVLDAGKNVIVTAHSRVKEEADPQGSSVLKYVPYVETDIWMRLHRWASGVFLLAKRLETDNSKKGLKKVAKENFDRLLFVEGTPYCEAKNWYGMHGVVPMGDSSVECFTNLMKAMKR